MVLITLNYDVQTGLKRASQMIAEVAALDVDRGELDLLQMTVVGDITSEIGSNLLRRSITLETSAAADQSFPTDEAKASATAQLFKGALELLTPGLVTAHAPLVSSVTPLDLPDLIAWWNPGVLVTLNPSGGVTQWLAQGSSGADGIFIPSTATAPAYAPVDGDWNGRPAMVLDAAASPASGFEAFSSFGFWDFLHDGGPMTLVVVFRPSGASSGTHFVASTCDGTAAETGIAIFYDGTAGTFTFVIANSSGGLVVNETTAGAYPTDQKYWIAFRYEEGRTPNEYSIWVNGVEVASGNGTGAPDAGNSQYPLEIGTDPALTDPLDATLTDVVATGSYVPDAELTALGVSFANQYGSF